MIFQMHREHFARASGKHQKIHFTTKIVKTVETYPNEHAYVHFKCTHAIANAWKLFKNRQRNMEAIESNMFCISSMQKIE